MAAGEDEPGAWAVQKTPSKAEPQALKEEIQRLLIKHCRHDKCRNVQDGFHPWKRLQEVLKRHNGKWYEVSFSKAVMADCERAIVTSKGLAAAYGHTRGQPPPYDEYQGHETLYHMTRAQNVEPILIDGLKSMGRGYIHLTKGREPKTRGRTKAFSILPDALRETRLKLWLTANPDVILCKGPISTSLIKYES